MHALSPVLICSVECRRAVAWHLLLSGSMPSESRANCASFVSFINAISLYQGQLVQEELVCFVFRICCSVLPFSVANKERSRSANRHQQHKNEAPSEWPKQGRNSEKNRNSRGSQKAHQHTTPHVPKSRAQQAITELYYCTSVSRL